MENRQNCMYKNSTFLQEKKRVVEKKTSLLSRWAEQTI